MSEISEREIKNMTKEQNYLQGYKDGYNDALDEIKTGMDKYLDIINKHRESEEKG